MFPVASAASRPSSRRPGDQTRDHSAPAAPGASSPERPRPRPLRREGQVPRPRARRLPDRRDGAVCERQAVATHRSEHRALEVPSDPARAHDEQIDRPAESLHVVDDVIAQIALDVQEHGRRDARLVVPLKLGQRRDARLHDGGGVEGLLRGLIRGAVQQVHVVSRL